MKESVVKVDSELLKRVEHFLELEENRIRYSSKKQFVDIAILEMLQRASNKKTGKLNYERRGKNAKR